MSDIYQQTPVLKFLKIAELWGHETNTDMWTVARIMAVGHSLSQEDAPSLLIHHVSMLDGNGNHSGKGGFRNRLMHEAIKSLQNDAPDQPTPLIINGLHDICISKENFRLWCLGNYRLPQFWFTEKERFNFSEAEKVQIERLGKLTVKDLQKSNDKIFDPKISFYGVGINLKNLLKSIRKRFGQNTK